ncbi:hypothetical protein DFH09DRAFT_1079840 [Mycena vulgaris]|nr:hypothetical protein DFH09DRAFT_1079840 [Mycena vulgaris]
MLHHIGKFAEYLCCLHCFRATADDAVRTLHNVHAFVGAQQYRSRIKQFFRKGEMSVLLNACTAGLQEALDAFKVQSFNLLDDVADMQRNARQMHEEVLELIASLSDASSDRGLSMNRVFFTAQNSSNSISMLPSKPKIFHGRESELLDILEIFNQEKPRIAILRAGGIGKTSLARVVLHQPEISSRYEQKRFFVPCDTVSTSLKLADLIGAHLVLKPGRDLTKPVVHHFMENHVSCLLVLDNLETCWEPLESRKDVEEFFSHLTDIPHLALVVRAPMPLAFFHGLTNIM